jgi:hypothetical protein
LILIFLGLAGFAQIPLLWHAQAFVGVLSSELQLLVALGAMVVLGGAYVYMAEAMYRWAHIVSKRKVRKRQRAQASWIAKLSGFARIRQDMPALVGAGLLTCVFFMFYFLPFAVADGGGLPSWIATMAFLDSIYVYPIAVNAAAIGAAVVASYLNYKIR